MSFRSDPSPFFESLARAAEAAGLTTFTHDDGSLSWDEWGLHLTFDDAYPATLTLPDGDEVYVTDFEDAKFWIQTRASSARRRS
jgi:hypothetical protein